MQPKGCALSIIGLAAVALATGALAPLGFVAWLTGAIMAGGMHSLKFDTVQGTVVVLDRRCWDGDAPPVTDPRPCTARDVLLRRAALLAPPPPPIRDGNSTHYPAKKGPEPGMATASIEYFDRDGKRFVADVKAGVHWNEFYEWEENGTAPIQVCRRDPTITRISPIERTDC